MTLYKVTYFFNSDNKDKIVIPGIDVDKLCSVKEEIMYWRKVNAIHGWFIDNCADGEDNNCEIEITIDDLKKLNDTISEVLNNRDKAMVLLPPREGFFFGNCEIDDYYWEELERTHKELGDLIMLDAIEGNTNNGNIVEHIYHPSW